LNYRPEIDGLRALAVLGVIFYHAELLVGSKIFFSGGYLGVDIFFIISGYLIGRILFSQLYEIQKIDLIGFYTRRILRILPMLTLTILLSFIIGYFLLLPTMFVDFAKSAVSAILSIANIYFYYSNAEYGAPSELIKPLLNTWSLGVEEQFYLIFPLVIIGMYKYTKAWICRLLLLILFVSLCISVYLNISTHAENFYLIYPRAWELLSGTILSFIEINHSLLQDRKYSNYLSIAGIILIILSFSIFKLESKPSIFSTLIPLSGTMLFISSVNSNSIIYKVLQSSLFKVIGLSSYSSYLIHFPVFAYCRIYMGDNFDSSNLQKLIAIVVCIIFSIFTYKMIELPFRFKYTKKIAFLWIIIGFLLIIFLSIVTIFSNGFQNRSWVQKLKYLNIKVDNRELALNVREFLPINSFNWNSKSKKKILIVGDSHAKDLFLCFYTNQNIFNSYGMSYFNYEPGNNYSFTELPIVSQADVVIFSYRWSVLSKYKCISEGVCASNPFINHVLEISKILRKEGKTIAITSNTTEFELYNQNSNTIIDKLILTDTKSLDRMQLNDIRRLYFNNRNGFFNSSYDFLKQFTIKNNLIFLDKNDYICNNNQQSCEFIDSNGHKLIYDYGHYTVEGFKYFGEKIKAIGWLNF
jgi:peptidoglycan/LPS O-acetylase OafA/YrhL